MDEYDVGLLNDWGGGNVAWWHDYLRYEIGRANSHWIQQTESLRAELAECKRLLHRYRNETPLGHQPHRIAHEVDAALAAKGE